MDDEGGILIWVDHAPLSPGGPGVEDTQSVIAADVAKNGLTFTRVGGMLQIDLMLETVAENSRNPVSFKLSSGVRMRN